MYPSWQQQVINQLRAEPVTSCGGFFLVTDLGAAQFANSVAPSLVGLVFPDEETQNEKATKQCLVVFFFKPLSGIVP